MDVELRPKIGFSVNLENGKPPPCLTPPHKINMLNGRLMNTSKVCPPSLGFSYSLY